MMSTKEKYINKRVWEKGVTLKRYVVVACPKCGWVRGAEACVQTVSCPNCGKINKMKSLVWLAEIDGSQNLPEAVAAVRSKLTGETASSPSEPPKRQRRRRYTVEELCSRLSSGGKRGFTLKEFLSAMEEHGHSSGEEKLKKLLEAGLLYQPSPGLFMWLG